MPWNQSSPMNERTLFVADVLRGVQTFSDICAHYNVSRTTGYKWIRRHRDEGPAGLHERSRRPASCPAQTPAHVVDAIVQARRHHPKWGPKKLKRILRSKDPDLPLPARSTVCSILKREGLVPKVRRCSSLGHPGKPVQNMDVPNATWCTDFKGHFKTGDGIYCYPLTTTDACSRYLLGCKALYSTAHEGAKPAFQRLFEEFGLPQRMRSDNGVPFATTGLARLSRLAVWWIRLGILPELIEPGKPQQNGRHERMHRTLKG
jgi:putative transposase